MDRKSQFASLAEVPPSSSERGLVHWPPDRLKPYGGNARTHTQQQIAQIAASIEEFGFTNPILARSDGTIAAGHGRLEAAKLLALASVPVIIIDGWSEDQFRAYVIADNQLAQNAGWDVSVLAAELQALDDSKFNLSLLGFDTAELSRALGQGSHNNADLDDAPCIPVNPVTEHGDLWICGEHQVLCGDSTDPFVVDRLLAGNRAAMCFTDPPYNVDYANPKRAPNKHRARPIMNDALGAGFENLLRAACARILESTSGAVYICMSSTELPTLQRVYCQEGGKFSTSVVWVKNTFTLGRSDYQRQYEPILYGWREGAPHHWVGSRDQGDVWFFDKPSRSDLHPTMKPVALVERAILNSSKCGDLVFDPFGGSGTTLIAAWRTGRRARLIELDRKYVDVIVRRWQDLTGKSATLEGTGETFEQIKSRRLKEKVT